MMRYLLQTWKYKVVEAAGSTEEKLRTAKTYRPHLILISGENRQGDNLETTRRRREQSAAETGIVFISGFSEPPARAAGADDFLSKPIDFGLLETTLKRITKKLNETSFFMKKLISVNIRKIR